MEQSTIENTGGGTTGLPSVAFLIVNDDLTLKDQAEPEAISISRGRQPPPQRADRLLEISRLKATGRGQIAISEATLDLPVTHC